jgi:hypothetical protein
MPLSTGGEMTNQPHSQACGNGEDRYATREDFRRIVDEDLKGLYQLSFLLTGDHRKAEKCFVVVLSVRNGTTCSGNGHAFGEARHCGERNSRPEPATETFQLVLRFNDFFTQAAGERCSRIF